MSLELVIFDCDGVLVDSEPLANRVLAGELTSLGFPHTVEDCDRRYRGLSMPRMLEEIETQWGRALPPDFERRLQARTFDEFEHYLVSVPGVEAVLDFLEQQQIRFCVASSGRPDKMRFTLGQTELWPRFDGRLYSAVEVREGKPAPDLFLHAAAQEGAAPQNCLVIEDSLPGVEAAVAARMQVFGFCADLDDDSREAMDRMGARLCDSMDQVLQALHDVLQHRSLP